MHFVWPMTTVVLFISFFENGNVKGNNLEIQVTQKLKEMLDLKEHLESLQKDIEKYISSFSNNNGLMKLNSIVQALAQEKVIRINFGQKIESMLEAYGHQLTDLETTVENIDRDIENRLLANTNATEVSFRYKIQEAVITIEEKCTGSMSKLHQTLENLNEQFNQWRVPKLVNGDWTAWGSWTRCSSSCGSGVKNRVRTCTNPTPANGGNDCVGDALECVECRDRFCPGHTYTAMPFCDYGWERYLGSCYLFVNNISRSWTDAKALCEGANSYLLRIDNREVFGFIQNVLRSKGMSTHIPGYWTGAYYNTYERQWQWYPAEKMRFTVWWPQEPNNKHGTENCGELNKYMHFQMNDYACWEKLYFICEKLLVT